MYIRIESLKGDTAHKTQEIRLKNPFLFCFASTADFKVQIYRNGEVCYTAFMDRHGNKQKEIQFRPSPYSNYDFDGKGADYAIEITNREVLSADFYISIWK
jgi:hypothetical protein